MNFRPHLTLLWLGLFLAAGVQEFASPPLTDEARSTLLVTARELLAKQAPWDIPIQVPDTSRAGTRMVVISLSREKATALVGVGLATTLDQALRAASEAIIEIATESEIAAGRIKIDVAVERSPVLRFDRNGGAEIDGSLHGLWFPPMALLLLPGEMTSHKLIDQDGVVQSETLAVYLLESRKLAIDENPGRAGQPYGTVQFDSFMEGARGNLVRLFRGNSLPAVDPQSLLNACREGGDYLVRHQRPDGLFHYNYEPKTNEVNADYNELRHAGAAYSLMELYRTTKEERYRAAGERAIEGMLQWVRSPEGKDFETIVYRDEEAKLGGSALALLAILQHYEATGETRWMNHAVKLARFLVFQQSEDGRFESKYYFGPAKVEPHESYYYPGEAILALTRMQRADPSNQDWAKAASRGVNWLVEVRDANQETAELPHDHWLLQGMNELYPLTRNKAHLAHVERIAQSILLAQRIDSIHHPDWIGSFGDPPLCTPTATRGEALVAMWELAGKAGRNRDAYLEALKMAAAFQLRCQINQENAIYLPRPDLARGGFRSSLDDWQVRIDFNQHNVSSLLGLRKILIGASHPTAE